jgi:hypothetical protein
MENLLGAPGESGGSARCRQVLTDRTARSRVGVCKMPLRWKPHDIRDRCSDWIQEDCLVDAGPDAGGFE